MQLVHTSNQVLRKSIMVVASAMMVLASTAPLAQAAEVTGCRNTQITSYTPASGADLEVVDMIEYTLSDDTDVSSLSVRINGDTYPVQYRTLDEGGYQAFVMFPQDVKGSVYVDMYADSESEDACDTALATSFVVDPDDEYTQYGVMKQSYTPVTTTPSTSNAPTVTTTTNTPAAPATQGVVAVAPETDGETATASDEETASTSASTTATTSDELAASTTPGFATQAAALFQMLSGSDQAECTEGASQWPWYVWLGIIWLWLVVMWLVIGYTVEPIYGNDRYARRLAITVALGTGAMLLLWWIASSCHNQFWVPLVLALLGVALYWLYSEDTDYPSDLNRS